MKGILHTVLFTILSISLAFGQNDQCIGPNIGTGALYTQRTVGCVPFTVQIEKTDENSTDNQYIFKYTGGPPVNAVTQRTYTYTQPGAYKLMQISYRKDTKQELRICTIITVLDTAHIEINPKICDNTISLNLNDERKNGTIPYDFCYINWGDGSTSEKVNLPSVSITHIYTDKSARKINVKGGYIVDNCGGTSSINLQFPTISEPKIQELVKTGENKFTLSFNNETGDDYTVLADGNVLLTQKGKLGQERVSFEHNNINACYRVQLQNSCFTNTISKEVCDIGFSVKSIIDGNELMWSNPSRMPIKDFILTKNNTIDIPLSGTSYPDNEVDCNEEVCYQVRFKTNESVFIGEKLCIKNTMIPCGTLKPIHIPSAFSPNNDGINDKLFLFGDLEKFISLKIFNRRGHVVKQIDYPYEAWNGDDLPAGIYEYLLKFKTTSKQENTLQGTITLLK
ncbi:gliding motility-associated C-terminal domain-containing protein [Emticicia soli]|uniref:Gliding motility-associated C-terminal domain-containing protein n=1 Tax=Emticicia soli TaxID=2027878 RepID=A0ABW5JDA2_9BACT